MQRFTKYGIRINYKLLSTAHLGMREKCEQYKFTNASCDVQFAYLVIRSHRAGNKDFHMFTFTIIIRNAIIEIQGGIIIKK